MGLIVKLRSRGRRSALLFLLLSVSVSAGAGPQRLDIALLASGDADHAFWRSAVGFAEAVAADLNINLRVHYTAGDSASMKRAGRELLAADERPRYLVTSYVPYVTAGHLETALGHGIKVITINADVLDDERRAVGAPREKFTNWIGQLVPDDRQAGYVLADALIDHAESKVRPGRRVRLIGLAGGAGTSVAADRNAGLRQRIGIDDRVELAELRGANWERGQAEIAVLDMLDQYRSVSVVWAASDVMALGGVDALRKLGIEPGEDVLLGGVDWSALGIRAIADGTLTATVGGHFMEAGWALVLIHDYHYGLDFRDDLGVKYLTRMSVIDAGNVGDYLHRFGGGEWADIDFKRFSRFFNKELDRYDFSLRALLRQPL